MVNQNYILYVNEKRVLRAAKINLTEVLTNHNLKFSIPEKHLICGMILKGRPIKADRLKDFPFKPIEKYLFEFSNIHFIIPDMEFTVENTDYDFNIVSLEDILEVLPPNLFLNPLTIFSTRSRTSFGNIETIGISVPFTGNVSLYLNGVFVKNLGLIEAMPNPVPVGFNYSLWNNEHTFDCTDTSLDVLNMANVSFFFETNGFQFNLTHEGLSNFTYVDNSKTMGSITNVYSQWDEGFFSNVLFADVNWISAVDVRMNINYKVFNYKKPGYGFVSVPLFFDGYNPNPINLMEVCYQIFNSYDFYTYLPVGTTFFFSDSLGEFTSTNHKLII